MNCKQKVTMYCTVRSVSESMSLRAVHETHQPNLGQPESGAPQAVARAAAAAATSNVLGYTDAFGLMELRDKVAKHYESYYGVSVDTKRIVVTTGSSGAFLLVFTACFDAGDVVAVASSGYPCYRNILSALGVKLAHISINQEFKLTAKELECEIQRRETLGLDPIKGLILSSPSNPTGAMLSTKELQELCAITEKHNIQFLSDEIYHGITYGRKADTALQHSNQAVIINSFSKYYSSTLLVHAASKMIHKLMTVAVSGWRLGWLIVPDELIHAINSLQQNMFINAPTISQTAALSCWDDDAIQELESHVAKYAQNRTFILAELATLLTGCTISPSDGGFYVYVDMGDNTAPGYDSIAMCAALLEESHVAFTPGVDFEDPDTNLGAVRFRISYSQGTTVIQSAMQRFRSFWPTWVDRVTEAKRLYR